MRRPVAAKCVMVCLIMGLSLKLARVRMPLVITYSKLSARTPSRSSSTKEVSDIVDVEHMALMPF